MTAMHYFRALIALFSIACLTACSDSPEPVKLDTMTEGAPALWKLTGSKPEQLGSLYLFGTIHVLPENVKWRTPKLEAAINESDSLTIEVLGLEDTKATANIFAKLAISPNQPELDERVKPELRDDLDIILDNSNLPEFALKRMETWAVALSIASSQTEGLGLKTSEGVEKRLSAQFNRLKKPIEGLETISQQLGYFDTLPESQQREMLESVVEEAGDTKKAFEGLFNAWISGDVEAIAKLSEGGILEDPKARKRLLVDRNTDWTEQLDKRLQKTGISFVAVGAAHLVGPDGVQTMLEERGYKVERIQ